MQKKTKYIISVVILLILLIPIDFYTSWTKVHAGSAYYKGITGVYFRKCNDGFFGCSWSYERISGDIFRFKYIGSRSLAVDSKHVYCGGEILDANRNTLKVLDGDFQKVQDSIEKGVSIDIGMFKDDKKVYTRYCNSISYAEEDDHSEDDGSNSHSGMFDAPSFEPTQFQITLASKSYVIYQDKNGIYYYTPRYHRFVRLNTESGPLSIKIVASNSFEIKGRLHTYLVTKDSKGVLLNTTVK